MNKLFENITKIIQDNGGMLVSEYKGPMVKIDIKCRKGHIFTTFPPDIYSKKWCEKCLDEIDKEDPYKELTSILEENEFSFKKNVKIDDMIFSYSIESDESILYIDIDNLDDPEYINKKKNKIEYVFSKNFRILNINMNKLSDPNLTDFIFKSLFQCEINFFPYEDYQNFLNGKKETLISAELRARKKGILSYDNIEEGVIFDPFSDQKVESNPKVNIAYLYCRVSTIMQSEKGKSIETQIYDCITYAKSLGMRYMVICDRGKSGKDMINRPGITQIMEKIKKGDVLVTYNISRLIRNDIDGHVIKTKLKSIGARLVFLESKIEDTPEGDLIYSVFATLAAYERNSINRKISHVLNVRSAQNKLVVKPSFGWMISEIPGKGHVINPSEQKTIAEIKNLYKTLPVPSFSNICRELNSKKIKCRKAKEWRPDYLKKIMIQNNIINIQNIKE